MTQGDEGGKSEGEPDPPDGGWGWVVAFASFMAHLIIDGVTYSFGVLYIEFLSYFNEGAAATSWIASILVGVTFCSGPIASILVNKYGCQVVAIGGAILASICLILSMFATNVITLYITIGVGTGLGFGLIFLPAIVSVTCWFKRKRALAIGIAVSGSGIGTFVFSPLTNWLVSEYGWRGTLLILAGLVLQCTIFGALFRPVYHTIPKNELNNGGATKMIVLQENGAATIINVLQDNGKQTPRTISSGNIQNQNVPEKFRTGSLGCIYSSEPKPKQQFQSQTLARRRSSGIMSRSDILYFGSIHNIPRHKGSRAGMDEKTEPLMGRQNGGTEQSESEPMVDVSLFKDPIFVILCLAMFFTQIGFNVPYVYVVAQATARNVPRADLILSVIGIANTLGRVIIGILCDRTSEGTRLWINNACLIGCGIATALSAFCDSFATFAVYGAAFGFLIGAYVNLYSVVLADLMGLAKLTTAFGMILLFAGIAALIGPPIAGWLYDALLSYDPGFVGAGAMIALSGVALSIIPIYQKREINKMKLCKLNGVS